MTSEEITLDTSNKENNKFHKIIYFATMKENVINEHLVFFTHKASIF